MRGKARPSLRDLDESACSEDSLLCPAPVKIPPDFSDAQKEHNPFRERKLLLSWALVIWSVGAMENNSSSKGLAFIFSKKIKSTSRLEIWI